MRSQVLGKRPNRKLLYFTSFSPLSLFANGEQGVWYDPSDFSTMFTDSAGTTPVTAVEQPVGLILDKSGRGNHASQSTSASRPVLSARVNVFPSSDFTAATRWVGLNTTKDSTTSAPDGIGTAQTIKAASAGDTYHFVYSAPYSTIISGVDHTFSIYAKSGTGRYVHMTLLSSSGNYFTAVFDLGDATKTQATQTKLGATSGTITSTSQTALGSGWYLLSVIGKITASFASGEVGFAGAATGNNFVSSSGEPTFNASGTETLTIYGADLRVTNDGIGLPAFQRVAASTDYDTAGFPMYLRFDGVDDGLVTPSIDFTATNKMSVFAGVRKLSDAQIGIIAETSSEWGNAGAFGVYGNNTAAYVFAVSGTGAVGDNAKRYETYTSPITNLLYGQLNTTAANSNASQSVRINGADVSGISAASNAATGNFGNYPLYVGSRAGSSLRFNGRLYGLIVRGAASTATEIANAEAWMNNMAKAY